MALTFVGKMNVPNYTALSTDIVASAIPGASIVGATIFTIDDAKWYIVESDLTLSSYVLPVTATLGAGSAIIGKVAIDQVTANANEVVLKASEAHVGQVTGSTSVISVTPVISASSIYAANDVVGTKMELALAGRVSGMPVTLQSLVITDLAMQNAALNIFIFQGNPATGTYTDNLELDIDDTDMIQCVGVLSTTDGQWLSAKDNSVFTMQNIGLIILPTTTSVWFVAKTTGAPTYATTSDLVFKFGFYRE